MSEVIKEPEVTTIVEQKVVTEALIPETCKSLSEVNNKSVIHRNCLCLLEVRQKDLICLSKGPSGFFLEICTHVILFAIIDTA